MSRTPPRPDSGLYPDWKSWAGELLRYLEERERQWTDEARYQLATHPSTDLPSAAQEGLLLFKPDTLKVSVSFSEAFHDLGALDQANTWTAAQTIVSTDAGAGIGPVLYLLRDSASPAASDLMGTLSWRGKNSNNETIDYCTLYTGILNPADGAEGAQFIFWTYSSGAQTQRLNIGAGILIGNPAGGFPGNGSINMAAELRQAGDRVVSGRKTGWSTATGNATRSSFDTATVTLPELAERVKALIDDLHATAGHGLIGT